MVDQGKIEFYLKEKIKLDTSVVAVIKLDTIELNVKNHLRGLIKTCTVSIGMPLRRHSDLTKDLVVEKNIRHAVTNVFVADEVLRH